MLALAFSVLFTWWYGPFEAISGRMTAYGAYEVSGLVFAAPTLFASMLGALLGLVIRRTVSAMSDLDRPDLSKASLGLTRCTT